MKKISGYFLVGVVLASFASFANDSVQGGGDGPSITLGVVARAISTSAHVNYADANDKDSSGAGWSDGLGNEGSGASCAVDGMSWDDAMKSIATEFTITCVPVNKPLRSKSPMYFKYQVKNGEVHISMRNGDTRSAWGQALTEFPCYSVTDPSCLAFKFKSVNTMTFWQKLKWGTSHFSGERPVADEMEANDHDINNKFKNFDITAKVASLSQKKQRQGYFFVLGGAKTTVARDEWFQILPHWLASTAATFASHHYDDPRHDIFPDSKNIADIYLRKVNGKWRFVNSQSQTDAVPGLNIKSGGVLGDESTLEHLRVYLPEHLFWLWPDQPGCEIHTGVDKMQFSPAEVSCRCLPKTRQTDGYTYCTSSFMTSSTSLLSVATLPYLGQTLSVRHVDAAKIVSALEEAIREDGGIVFPSKEAMDIWNNRGDSVTSANLKPATVATAVPQHLPDPGWPLNGEKPPQFYQYCETKHGYYPLVTECPTEWRKVLPAEVGR